MSPSIQRGPVTMRQSVGILATVALAAGALTPADKRRSRRRGGLAVRDTSGWVRVTRSQIAGLTRIYGTTSEVAPDLSRSHVAGSLSCLGNQTPPFSTAPR